MSARDREELWGYRLQDQAGRIPLTAEERKRFERLEATARAEEHADDLPRPFRYGGDYPDL